MKVLVTGFDPFGGEKVNPAYEAVKLLSDTIAVNLAEAGIPDNNGEQPMDEPLQPDGETAYFATIPVKAVVKNICDHGIPCKISYSAGTYVCNCVMYNVLYMASVRYPNIRAGFIHVPYAAQQAVGKPEGTPFMSQEQIAEALEYAIEAAVENGQDIKEGGGATH